MPSPRTVVADKLRAHVPEGVTVYEVGQDVLATPCVVVHNGDPYLVPTTMGVDASVQVFLNLYIISNRTSLADALTQLEEIRYAVAEGVKDPMQAPIGRWTTFGRFGGIDVGGTQYAASVLETVFVMADNPPSA